MQDVKPITPAGKSRFALYIMGGAAGVMALAGYADFDPQTWMLDIKPFNLKEFVLTSITTGGNVLAADAVYTGLKSR